MSAPEITIPDLEPGPITRTTLALFAGASGDHNPIHIDLDAAKAAGLDDVFAHGMLSMAYLGRLLTDAVPQSRIRELSTRFTAITPVLAEPRLSAESVPEESSEETLVLKLSAVLPDGTRTMSGRAVLSLA
ncbi:MULTISPECIES: MaoC/PaaZ C-terminal domain-containing protein [Rhodococcus]|uniref:MaoC/PaaZ C-terminal domain-containing protein n=1 Tax=Rhodococcus TaxID=1827 RepID=UPI00082BEBAB|nr:MaoC/PaaZ C-terminal domain-containing protein [Rhodococcus phenolicus]